MPLAPAGATTSARGAAAIRTPGSRAPAASGSRNPDRVQPITGQRSAIVSPCFSALPANVSASSLSVTASRVKAGASPSGRTSGGAASAASR